MCSSMNAISCSRSCFTRGEYSKSMSVSLECDLAVGVVSALHPFDEAPRRLGEPAGPSAGFEGLVAGCGAVHGPLHDPLQDAREPEHVVRDVEVPVLQHLLGIAPDAPAVHLHVFPLARDAEGGVVQP